MIEFLKKQFKKEKVAAKRAWNVYLKILVVFWGLMGFIILSTPAWPLGLVFIIASAYVFYRKRRTGKIIDF